MIRGIGTSVRGMAVEQGRSDVIGHNVANVNTDGFKRSLAISDEFQQLLIYRLGDQEGGEEPVGRLGNGATLAQVLQDQALGPVESTETPLDLALLGPGQFTYLGPEGLEYTRQGRFQQDAAGRLVTAEGDPVLAGGLPVGSPGSTIRVERDGGVLVDGTRVGRLDIPGGEGTPVASKAVEKSNVDLGQEMSELMISLRSFQVNQRALQMQDETLGKAVSELGRV